MGSYVGIDLHRRRSVVVVLNEDGDRVSWSRIDNTPTNLAAEIVAAGGPAAEVAMEATWGWYWAADVIAECDATLHLAHPLGIAGYENRRVRNDIRDATLLADLLRMGRLPEAWIAPPQVRELREAVRYRAKLSRLRAGLKAQVHQTLGKEGVIPELNSIWKTGGQQWLDDLRLGDEYVNRIESLRDLIEGYDREIRDCDTRIYRRLKGHPGYEAVQALRGVAAPQLRAYGPDQPRPSRTHPLTAPHSTGMPLCTVLRELVVVVRSRRSVWQGRRRRGGDSEGDGRLGGLRVSTELPADSVAHLGQVVNDGTLGARGSYCAQTGTSGTRARDSFRDRVA